MNREEKTWNKAVMYGIGHGDIESVVLVGGLGLLSLLNILVTSSLNLNTLTASQHAAVVHQFAAINAQPAWFSLLGAWERLWTSHTYCIVGRRPASVSTQQHWLAMAGYPCSHYR